MGACFQVSNLCTGTDRPFPCFFPPGLDKLLPGFGSDMVSVGTVRIHIHKPGLKRHSEINDLRNIVFSLGRRPPKPGVCPNGQFVAA